MKIFLFRTLFLLLLIFLQVSFFSIMFPWFRAPLFLLGVIASCILVRGFPSGLWMTVPLTLLFDTISAGAVTWFSLYAVLFAYATSFLSRRLLLEHRGSGLVLYALIAYGAALFYQVLVSAIIYRLMPEATVLLRSAPTSDNLLFSLLVFFPTFFISHVVIEAFERWLERMNQKQFRNIR